MKITVGASLRARLNGNTVEKQMWRSWNRKVEGEEQAKEWYKCKERRGEEEEEEGEEEEGGEEEEKENKYKREEQGQGIYEEEQEEEKVITIQFNALPEQSSD